MTSNESTDPKDLVLEAKEMAAQEAADLEKWFKQLDIKVDSALLLEEFEATQNGVREALIKRTLVSMALTSGVEQIPAVLSAGLGLKDISMDISSVRKLSNALLSVEICNEFLSRTSLTQPQRKKISRLFIDEKFKKRER